MEKGLIHLYTGDGKGKTTAAIGLAVRAAGAGKSVCFVQFMKGQDTAELQSFRFLPGIRVLRSEKDFGFYPSMSEADKEELTGIHNRILTEAIEAVNAGQCDVLILDEATYPVKLHLIDEEALKSLVEHKNTPLELVLTGRDAPDFMVEAADYITRMKMERHPFEKGIMARKGIEY